MPVEWTLLLVAATVGVAIWAFVEIVTRWSAARDLRQAIRIDAGVENARRNSPDGGDRV